MQKLMDDIKNKIRAEKLLFSDNEEYTSEEIRFISSECFDTIQKEPCYMYVLYKYLPKLYQLYVKHPEENFFQEIYDMGLEVGRWSSKTKDEKELDEQWAYFLYNNFLGLPKKEDYYSFIKNRIMDIDEVRSALYNGCASELYSHNTNFLITNNFLLIHYPRLYTMDDLCQLKDIAYNVDKNKFETKEEYDNFKIASAAMKFRLKRYEKSHNVKIKTK